MCVIILYCILSYLFMFGFWLVESEQDNFREFFDEKSEIVILSLSPIALPIILGIFCATKLNLKD